MIKNLVKSYIIIQSDITRKVNELIKLKARAVGTKMIQESLKQGLKVIGKSVF